MTSLTYIRGHKGQNSTGTRSRGFLSSEKVPWNHDVVAYLSPFLDVVVFWSWNLDVVVFWSWNLDVVVFWTWNLDVVVFWSWNLDFVVYVPSPPRFLYHRENKKITHNYVNNVIEKYFRCPNLCNIYLHNDASEN